MTKCFFQTVATLAILLATPTFAAQIDWQPAQATTISAANDIVDGGNVVLALNGHSQGDSSSRKAPATVTLDGIVFDSIPIPDFLGRQALDVASALSSPNSTGDVDYDTFLTHVAYTSVSVSGLAGSNDDVIYPIPGLELNTEYFIQVWFTDERPGRFTGSPRVATYGDNESTENTVDVPGIGANGFGNFAVGRFMADSTTQDLRLAIDTSDRAHLTGILVRTVPEPTSLWGIACGSLALLCLCKRRRVRTSPVRHAVPDTMTTTEGFI